MLYFIPAWYRDNEWKENEQFWYLPKLVTECDDTVKEVQLFYRNELCPMELLLLSHTPNLRHFLHRQGLYHVTYWSIFDSMQGIRRRSVSVFSFRDLKWPEGTSFSYSGFAVLAYLHGEKYAKVEFGEDGNMIQVDLYQEDTLVRKNVYDDRGFISLTILYENGEPKWEQYLDEKGDWRFIRDVTSGQVDVNPNHGTYILSGGEVAFQKSHYLSIEEMIQEVLEQNLLHIEASDIFLVAAHRRHGKVLGNLLHNRSIILCYFKNRREVESGEELKSLLEKAGILVVDTAAHQEEVIQYPGYHGQEIVTITPYDTRLEQGISQTLHVQNILLAFDDLHPEDKDPVITILGQYMGDNPYAMVHIFTRKAGYQRPYEILNEVRHILMTHDLDPEMARDQEEVSENGLDEMTICAKRFFVDQCVDEMSCNHTIRMQRLILDLGVNVDQFLQIEAISMGIPQIGMRENQYLKNGKNGRVLSQMEDLRESLPYYLESRKHWNEAMIWAYDIGRNFSMENLLEQWRGVVESIEY